MPETTPLMLHSEPRRRTRVGAVALAVLGACAVFALASVASEQTASTAAGASLTAADKSPMAIDKDDKAKAETDILAVYYKPHFQCGVDAGTTPDESAAFINAQMTFDEPLTRDFVGVSEWAPTAADVDAIGNPERYGSVAAVCGYGSAQYQTPMVLFHDKQRWDVLDSYPKATKCADVVFLPPWDGPGVNDAVCVDKTSPGDDDCCSCTFSEEEYRVGKAWNQGTGQRPWVAGLYRKKDAETEVCVVAGEFPHPLSNTTLWNLNGRPAPWGTKAIMRYICTAQYNSDSCIDSLDGGSVVFGTDVFTNGVADFCGDRPTVIMADTNVGAGDFASSRLFKDPRLSVQGSGELEPYTCCNDSHFDGGFNRYASDRFIVAGNDVQIERLEGGSVAPGGPLPDDLTLKCHVAQEHAPIRARISLASGPQPSVAPTTQSDAASALPMGVASAAVAAAAVAL
mmetsp:Transcript_25093/g.77369  ORF Transcript_25093/g.77369 Transcript_25093/m.77369 type:complete len:456 (+) Transcript_25093:197-1564(+)